MQQLPKNTLLQEGKYKIEKVLGQGGFGITYLANQELLERKVCIKEFFFKDSCSRNSRGKVTLGTIGNKDLVERFLNKFIKEARTISKLEHPNIIRILDIFMENGTAYYVMDYIEGSSLEGIVKKCGFLPETEAINYIKQIANALDYIHKLRINHLDVKPANIMIRKKDKKAVLIDFGVSKQYDFNGEQTSSTPVGISYGYAPIEQYRPGGVSEFSPQTDIYSLGATLYRLVVGNVPPQAVDLLMDDDLPEIETVSKDVALVIRKSMQVKRQSRPQNISEFINLLSLNNGNRKDTEETQIILKTKSNSSKAHEYVDLGLSVKWATCNIGADEPNESGMYFGWRKIFPIADNDSLELISFDDDVMTVVAKSNIDVANLLWGNNWRLPTNDEFEELKEKCTWVWTKMLGQNGYKIIGPNDNSIFLPAVGYHNGYDYQKCGYYRTSDCEMYNHNLYEPKLHFKENEFGVRIIVYPFNNERYWTDGYPVRAVMDK